MKRKNQAELMKDLENEEGYKFRTFELSSQGDFLPSDADWNYKDIPHLKNIHNLVEGFNAYAGDDFIGSIFIQKILGGLFKVPLSVFNYQSAKNQQTYFTSLFFFVLIIQTSYEQIGELRTKVTTRYAIGSSGFIKFLLPIVFPLMKWSIKKNFDDLMSGDIPMRTRRGELRKMGYCFKGDDKDYSFVETTKIMENNLISPKMEYLDFVPFEKILSDLEKDNPSLYGDSGILGFQAYKIADKVKLFPRICPHEGACLDRKKSGDNHVRCEWHGRLHKPLLEVDCSDKLIKAVRIELENSLPIMVTKNANSEW